MRGRYLCQGYDAETSWASGRRGCSYAVKSNSLFHTVHHQATGDGHDRRALFTLCLMCCCVRHMRRIERDASRIKARQLRNTSRD
jgi:hypothetical protein